MDFREVERRWQRRWKEARAFEPEIKEGKKFFITVPYPYMSGALHIGHGRTFTMGDIIARFKRLEGYNVLFPMAFHVTGTPVLAIADSIKNGDERVINLYRDYVRIYEDDEKRVEEIVQSFVDPERIASYFADKVIKDFQSMGYSIDWRRKFNTAEPIYNRFVEWQFRKLYERGVIRKGAYPITYSPADGNPVGEDDIEDGDVNKVSVMEFTAIKFEFEDGYLVAATLRPETIFGVTNLWINPDAEYCKVLVADEKWYISKEAAEKLKYQKEDVQVESCMQGSYFVGKKAKEPVNAREVPILPAEFVDPDNATGVVYSVPAHAPYDYRALEDLKKDEEKMKKYGLNVQEIRDIEPIKIIDIEGYEMPARDIVERMGIVNQKDERLEEATQIIYKDEFYSGILNEKCGEFAGIKISEIKDEVKEWLKDMKRGDVFYETSRKAITRNGNKVIVAVLRDQWFIDYSAKWWKDAAHAAVERMLFHPEKYRSMMHGIIDWLDKRPCARKRGLGTRFPWDKEWIIESLSDSTIYMAFYTVAHIIREESISPESLTPEVFDYVFLSVGDARNVSAKSGISEDVLLRMRAEFQHWYPNDLRHTAPAHLSNHLAFFIMHHVAIFPEDKWPGGISLNGMMIREGAKISKSKGNVIPLAHISSRYGVDLFRLYCAVAADMDTLMDWKESELSSLRRRFERLVGMLEDSVDTSELNEEMNHYDRWLLSRFYRRYGESIEMMRELRIRDATLNMISHFFNDVRYYEKHAGVERRRRIIRLIIENLLKILSPVVPHVAEELWHRLGHESFISLETLNPVKEEYINPELEMEMDYVDGVIADIKEILSVAKIKPGRVFIYTAEDWKWKVLESIKDASPKDAIRMAMSSGVSVDKGEIAKFVKRVLKEKIRYFRIDERKVLRREKDYISREIGAEVIVDSDYDPVGKRKFALPTKPAIYIEQ